MASGSIITNYIQAASYTPTIKFGDNSSCPTSSHVFWYAITKDNFWVSGRFLTGSLSASSNTNMMISIPFTQANVGVPIYGFMTNNSANSFPNLLLRMEGNYINVISAAGGGYSKPVIASNTYYIVYAAGIRIY